MQISDQTVLITGGTAGIGLALAKQFHSVHNHVIVTGRNAGKLVALRVAHPDWSFELANMADLGALDRLVQTYPHVSVLVNNAGVQYNYALADTSMPADMITQEIATNLLGPIYLTKRMLAQLLAKPSAAIVNITSSLSVMPKQSAPIYSAGNSKALR